jgi:hypothetical protein
MASPSTEYRIAPHWQPPVIIISRLFEDLRRFRSLGAGATQGERGMSFHCNRPAQGNSASLHLTVRAIATSGWGAKRQRRSPLQFPFLPHSISILLAHGSADPANGTPACTSLAETLRGQGALVEHRQFPGAGYAWDYPQLGAATEVLLPAPGRAERLPIRAWPALAAQTAAEVAGFFAQHFSGPKP